MSGLASPRLRSLRLTVLRVLLALGTTVLIIATTQQDTPFIVASRETFHSWLLEDEGIHRVDDKGFFYEVEDCAQAINRSLVTSYEHGFVRPQPRGSRPLAANDRASVAHTGEACPLSHSPTGATPVVACLTPGNTPSQPCC